MASQNIRRIELLRRRARSGSLKNIQELCAVTDSRTFVAHLPIFLKFLSENRPPQTDSGFKPEEHTDSLNSTDQVALARFVLWQIALGLQPKPGTRVTEDIPSIPWSVSEPVFNEILHLPSIRYTSVILRRLSADASNPNRTLTPIQETSLQVVWRFALEFLYESFNYGGYTSIIPALKSGLLLTLWNLSRAAEADPWVLHSNIASDELYINLVKLIAGSSMYRSVQRCLEKPLQTSPFSDVDIDPVVPNMSLATSTVWRDFKLLCVSRMRLRNYLETKYSFCSNDKCTTSGPRMLKPIYLDLHKKEITTSLDA
ncbi:hypothetical protein LENED_010555 [Lentinula edodes]|uniref:Uncharacterized protein n=1 Tax=Lentinula edodes TaxID=5353 RepID=A0A1Q3EMS2_LENED|nr:hypothetical protein LENED_010555 [Lentinula edodes]